MSGIVYFISAPSAGMIKIGYTCRWVEHRLTSLRSGSPVALDLIAWGNGIRRVESAFHEAFAADWSHGEWFRLTPAISKMAEAIGLGGTCYEHINPDDYRLGVFAAHIMHNHPIERVRCLDPNYVPEWVRRA